jgi:hypothetical protein
MKLIISSIIYFSSLVVFAGGSSGGGVGPRPTDSFLVSGGSWMNTAGVSGSGSGPRPKQVDYVNAIAINDDGQVKFKYKGFDSSEVQLHSLNLNEIADKYIEAIKRSKDSQNWEAVPAEGLGN